MKTKNKLTPDLVGKTLLFCNKKSWDFYINVYIMDGEYYGEDRFRFNLMKKQPPIIAKHNKVPANKSFIAYSTANFDKWTRSNKELK